MARKPAKSKGKSNRGGARPGAGRKPNDFNTLRLQILEAFDQDNVKELPRLFENMRYLANGRYERVEEEWTPLADGSCEMVLAKRKVSVAEPDRAANQYLIDRILGRPRQAIEVSGPGGSPFFPPEKQQRFLANPKAVALACQLEETLASGGPDPGDLRAECEPGEVAVDAAPGVPES